MKMAAGRRRFPVGGRSRHTKSPNRLHSPALGNADLPEEKLVKTVALYVAHAISKFVKDCKDSFLQAVISMKPVFSPQKKTIFPSTKIVEHFYGGLK
jgi:hypothetical protein